jgi:hypothetical protein
MKIKISELRAAANRLFDHLERSGHAELEVDRDFYWSIPDEKLYSVYEEPSGFTVGQLSDDWKELQRISSGQRQPIGYALVWLSSVLRFVGTKIVS